MTKKEIEIIEIALSFYQFHTVKGGGLTKEISLINSKLKAITVTQCCKSDSEQLGLCNFCSKQAIKRDEDGFLFCSKCLEA